jgi:hypothetical protein
MADFILPSSGVMTTKMVREHLQEMGVTTPLNTFTQLINAAIYSPILPAKPYRLSFFRNYRHDNINLSINLDGWTTGTDAWLHFQAVWNKAATIDIYFDIYSDQSGSYTLLKSQFVKGYGTKLAEALEKFPKVDTQFNIKCVVRSSPSWTHNGIMERTFTIPARDLNLTEVGRFGNGYMWNTPYWKDSGVCEDLDQYTRAAYTKSGMFEIGEKVYQNSQGTAWFSGSDNGTYYKDHSNGWVIKLGADHTIVDNNLPCGIVQ